ncbi:MAG TPA: OmpH family outer membrane protein, partial [Chitinophagaceae bacterium]|nr:OmpH family outer membrane protein [Chitinophagaceae bacterium]
NLQKRAKKKTTMKKLKVLVAAVCLVLVTNVSQAQTKIGYIDAETVLYLMPEVAKIDSMMRIYQTDTIGREYTSLLQNYQHKDSILRDTVAHPLAPAVKEQYQKDLFQLTQTLQSWQELAQQAYQNKQNQLLAPVMKKINDAINAVAKEKGYTHVLSRETLLVAPEADNLLQAVAKKLNITVPPQLLPGYKPPVGGGIR